MIAEKLELSYGVWKQVTDNNGFDVYFVVDSGLVGQGTAYCGNNSYTYSCRIDDNDWPDFDATYPSRVVVSKGADAVAQIVGVSNVYSYKTTGLGLQRVAVEKSSGTRKQFITHDFCDKTTWYTDSVRVVEEVASDLGTQTVYGVSNANIIDIYHGKISDEDGLVDDQGNSYRVVVTVNDVPKVEQDPHNGAGGDYTINYDTGQITFLSALGVSDVVKVTYHYSQTSVYVIRPLSGKVLVIENSEVQMGSDIQLLDTAFFDIYGFVDDFAPQLLDTADPPGPYSSGTKIILKRKMYKTIQDYINEANLSFPSYPAISASNWRGTDQSTIIFDWDYERHILLNSSKGMEIRISMEHDEPSIGRVIATMYGVSEDEI